MDRETREVITPSGKKVKIKTYLTYGEWREIQSVFLQNVKVGLSETGQATMSDFNAGVAFEAQNKVIEVLVVAIDGTEGDILNRFLGLQKNDTDIVLKELEKIQQEWSEDKKKE